MQFVFAALLIYTAIAYQTIGNKSAVASPCLTAAVIKRPRLLMVAIFVTKHWGTLSSLDVSPDGIDLALAVKPGRSGFELVDRAFLFVEAEQ